jgi:cysteinyl-tRNA synthetase
MLESAVLAPFAKSMLVLKNRFLEVMDDDFNTAGAIGVLHEMAGEINAFLEQSQAEKSKTPEILAAASAGVQTLRSLGNVLGLFKQTAAPVEAGSAAATLDAVMKLLIKLRQDARAAKNFNLADSIRDGLAGIGITLEDRPGETGWRKS